MRPWPFPADTELGRARRMAIVLRTHLKAANPTVCALLDAGWRDYGQFWILPNEVTYDDDDAVTADVAAELVSKPEQTIRRWATLPHPADPARPLLPRYGWDGRRRTYLVGDVRAAAALTARREERT